MGRGIGPARGVPAVPGIALPANEAGVALPTK
jgi:hypothetical protein